MYMLWIDYKLHIEKMDRDTLIKNYINEFIVFSKA